MIQPARREPAVHTMDDEEELARRVAAGDHQAYTVLVNKYLPMLLVAARRMMGNHAAAEDVVQDALLKLWTQAAQYDAERGRVSTWLYRITANLCIDRLRANRSSQLPDGFDQAEPPRQDRDLMENDLAERVETALQALPERQRLAMVLFHYQGLSTKQTAEIIDVSAEAVESLLARARRQLKESLRKDWQEFLPEDTI